MSATGMCGTLQLPTSPLQPFDQFCLHIVRLLCAGYEHDQLAYWDKALDEAETWLGPAEGTIFVARSVALMRAMRRERKPGFGFISPNCPHGRGGLTDDEADVMAVIWAGEMSPGDDLEDAALSLACAATANAIAESARALGAVVALSRTSFTRLRDGSVPKSRLN
jgi:hypothetical protein